jgi:hypothetical protein
LVARPSRRRLRTFHSNERLLDLVEGAEAEDDGLGDRENGGEGRRRHERASITVLRPEGQPCGQQQTLRQCRSLARPLAAGPQH